MIDDKYKVYMHICPNDKKYIGITCNDINIRWKNGKAYRLNKHFNNAILRYGWDNIKHEILFNGLTKEEAKKLEIELIAFYNTTNPTNGYNNSCGGEGKCGYSVKEETKQKIRNSLLGRKIPSDVVMRIANSHKGKKHTEEHNEKIRISSKKVKRGKPLVAIEKSSKKIKCLDTGFIYNSINNAARLTNIPRTSISACCRKELKHAGNLSWEYV